MNTEVKAVHFNLSDANRTYLDKKLERLEHQKAHIVDLLLTFTREKSFKAECTVNFRWGSQAHLVEDDFDLHAAMDKLIDKLDHKIMKEKERVQEKK